uniref:Uncharacterized protein n=1 Tax=Arundo donax TaxID=35708 RepID=A0A0A9AKS1_ARUDO
MISIHCQSCHFYIKFCCFMESILIHIRTFSCI